MVKIQLDLPKNVDDFVKHQQIDWSLKTKTETIKEIIRHYQAVIK